LGDGVQSGQDVLQGRADELRSSAERIAVLPEEALVLVDLELFLVRLRQLAAVEEVEDDARALDLGKGQTIFGSQ
jgi:hypothetical protein